jgi:hypothetical protein
LPEVPSSSRFLCGIKGLGRKAPAITLDQHNKTLQLTADGPTETVVICRIDQLTSTDAARQLSSMLGRFKVGRISHTRKFRHAAATQDTYGYEELHL